MAGSDLMAAAAGLGAQRNAWVRTIDVSTRPGAKGTGDTIVTARFVLGGGQDMPTRPLLLDARTCPFPILRLESNTLTLSVRLTGRRESLLPFACVPQSLDGASIEMDILWLAEGRDFVLPNMLPAVVGDVPGRPRPAIEVHQAGNHGLLLAGIPMVPGELAWGSPLIEAVLVRGKAVGKRRLVFTEMLAAEFDEHQIQRSEELVDLVLRFFERELDVAPGVRVTARAAREFLGKRLRGGSCIVLDDGDIRLGPAEGNPSDFLLAFQLASVWWGGGCQITGRRREELVTAIRVFLALRWLGWMDAGEVPETVERLRAFCSLRFLKNRAYAMQEGYRRDVASRIVLALFDEANHSSGVMDVLRDLTREAWGRRIAAEIVASRLRDAGVPVPI